MEGWRVKDKGKKRKVGKGEEEEVDKESKQGKTVKLFVIEATVGVLQTGVLQAGKEGAWEENCVCAD